MKRATTWTLNKKLKNIEDRLLGPKVRPIKIRLINTYSLEEDSKPDKARLDSHYQQAMDDCLLDIHIVEDCKVKKPLNEAYY